MDDIPNNIRKQLEFMLVEHMDEVLNCAMVESMNSEINIIRAGMLLRQSDRINIQKGI